MVKSKNTYILNQSPFIAILISSALLAFLGTVTSTDFIVSFGSWWVYLMPEPVLIRQILPILLGIIVGLVAIQYAGFYRRYGIYFFIAGIILLAIPLFQFNKSWVPLFTRMVTIHSGYWGILFSLPLMVNLLEKRSAGIKPFWISFVMPWVVLNLLLFLQRDFNILVLLNLLAMVILFKSHLMKWQKLGMVLVFLVLSISTLVIFKQDYLRFHWKDFRRQLPNLANYEEVLPVTCFVDLAESGITGQGLDSFHKPEDPSLPSTIRGFVPYEITPRQYPLKLLCRQLGWFGFALAFLLYYVLIHSSWFFVKGIQNNENRRLALMLFYLLFIPVGFQIIKNISPLGILPSYELHFLGWGPHNGMFPLVVGGLIYGLSKESE